MQGHINREIKQPSAATSDATSPNAVRTPRSAWATAVILLMLYALSFLDRQIMAMMIVPIQRDLQINDFQVSLLLGVAFALLYTTCGLFAGSFVDRMARRPLIAGGVVLWGSATALCSMAGTYIHMFIARMFVGLGESVLTPAAYSMLSDAFPPRRLALALGIFAVGTTAGAGISMVGGGALINFITDHPSINLSFLPEMQAWQLVFLIVGLGGVPLGFLIYLIPEPTRKGRLHDGRKSWADTLRFMASRKELWASIILVYGPAAMLNYGVTLWTPTYMIREFGWSIGHVGLVLGMIVVLAGASGQLFFGWLVDTLYTLGNRDIHLRFYTYATLVGVPVAIVAFMSSNPAVLIIGLAIVYALLMSFAGYAGASVQLTTPNEYRGRMAAVFMLVLNVPGLALGPPLIALLSTHGPYTDGSIGHGIAMTFILLGPVILFGTIWGRKYLKQALSDQQA